MSNYNRPGGSPLVWAAILLGLSAVAGILVAMLSGGGLGSGAPPDWTPPPPTATPQRSTATPVVEVSGQVTVAAAPTTAPEAVQASAATAAPATPVRVTATPTREVAPLRPAGTSQPLQPTSTPGLVVQVTAEATSEATGSPASEATAVESPAVAASPTAAATDTPGPTATAAPPTPTPLPPTPTPLPALSPPQLVSPANNASAGGEVEFTWAPTGELPPGTGYEVVVWNPGEDPAAARGVAPPTTGASLRANLDGMSQAGLFSGSQLNWTALIVGTDPYQRLTQPAASPNHVLNYQTGGGGGSEAPPPPPKP